MKKEHIIGGVVLGVLALGASAYAGYKNKDEIKAGIKKGTKVAKAKTKQVTKSVKSKKKDLDKNVKEGTDKLLKKLDSTPSLVEAFKHFEQEFKSSIKGEKVSEKELEALKAHFEMFSLDPDTTSSIVFEEDTADLDENDYSFEVEKDNLLSQ